ncbi:MAG: NADP-dependent malic enzyme, partial [Clostridiales bacterium]|nr:NADP-dependent malic enzyme [Clostridiales bacterium]
MDTRKEALRLHKEWGGKIEVNSRVPVKNAQDL